MNKNFLFLLLLTFLTNNKVLAQSRIQLETGFAQQYKNKLKITPSTGTTVDFSKWNKGFEPYLRLEAFVNFLENHTIRLVYAPLKISSQGQSDATVNFNNTIFNANENLTIDYRFNSYRLTYAYALINNRTQKLDLGLTAKVREAQIKFSQGARESQYGNNGFVPLIYFAFQVELIRDLYFYTDMDALAGPQGRALDVTAKVRKFFLDDFFLSLGGRILEGGADNEKVYTFSWFNFMSLDIGAVF